MEFGKSYDLNLANEILVMMTIRELLISSQESYDLTISKNYDASADGYNQNAIITELTHRITYEKRVTNILKG